MLLPKELDKLPDRVVELYAELENDIIRDMARRIVKTDFATDTAQWQLIQLQRLSVTHDEVFDRLSKATGKSKKELVKMFNEAADTAFSREDKAYRKAGYKTVPLAENVQLQKIINAGLRKTEYLFENLTNTTANTASRQFENALDRAYMQITSGAFDYNTAIRTCIRDLAQKGIAYITYPSGHTDYLDVAVRRAALTGVGQTCGEMQLELAAEMDCDLVEVTAHNGARPEHAVWQGKVFSLSGKSRKYPNFVKSTGYGTGAGLKGWNCRHDFFPFFEDSEPAYTQAELAEFENRQVTYNGEKMTEYEATQKQRAMERRIRATKRELAGYDAGIAAATDESLKAELQTAFDRKSVLLKRQEAALRDFTKQTGLARDRAREQVSAHFDAGQGKTVAFNKSVSQKAVQSNKRALQIEKEKRIIKNNNANSIENETLRTETFRVFQSGDEVNDFFYYDGEERGLLQKTKSQHGQWLKNLSADERDAISWYTADGYGDINDYWRKRSGWKSIPADMVEDVSSQIDTAISRFNLKENITVQCGVEDFYGASLLERKEWRDIHEIVGMTYQDLGYRSSTVLTGNSVAATKPVLFEIDIPAGTGRGAYVNKLAGQYEDVEYEFLIARGSKFEITDVIINEEPIPQQTIIKMRMIVDE